MATQRISVCQHCKRMFKSYVVTDICPICEVFQEKMFHEVKDYLHKNYKANMVEVCKHCEVSEKQVLKWVRQERLFFVEGSGVHFPCLSCGTEIKTGRYCPSCKTKLLAEIKGVYVEKSNGKKNVFKSQMYYHSKKHKL